MFLCLLDRARAQDLWPPGCHVGLWDVLHDDGFNYVDKIPYRWIDDTLADAADFVSIRDSLLLPHPSLQEDRDCTPPPG